MVPSPGVSPALCFAQDDGARFEFRHSDFVIHLMNHELVDMIVNAVLYEGYILYPYRASSKKNQRERFTFGRVYPKHYSELQSGREPWSMQTECLARNESRDAFLELTVKFLQPLARETDGQVWLEALEREVRLSPVRLNTPVNQSHEFTFAGAQTTDGPVTRRNEMISGRVELTTRLLDEGLVKISAQVLNETPVPQDKIDCQDEVLMRTFASTHTILHAAGGAFVSSLDPDPQYIHLAQSCRNVGTWPVLVGDKQKHERDAMLSSPIILYDYPKVASESAGDLFDSTEIDEILTLRVKTMTDQEKLEMANIDEHARRILERSEKLAAQDFMQMHGTMRDVRTQNEEFFNPAKKIESGNVRDTVLRKGDRVRIRPNKRADIMDMVVDGKIGIIEAVEEDVDQKVHFALVLEDDPGRDLGMDRQIGHRFFYSADEIEPI